MTFDQAALWIGTVVIYTGAFGLLLGLIGLCMYGWCAFVWRRYREVVSVRYVTQAIEEKRQMERELRRSK